MGDEKYDKYDSLPIPTYEEATSSRTASSQQHRGAQETSDDAERQGLLGRDGDRPTRNGEYHAPTVQSARPSVDSDLYLPEVTGDDDETAELRQDMEQMEIEEPGSARQGRKWLGTTLSKRITSLTHVLSSIPFPSLGFLTSRLPSIPEDYRVSLPVIARLFGLFLIALFIYVLFALDIIPKSGRMSQHYDPESVRARVQAEVDPSRIRDNLQYITSFDHVAGTEGDLFLAEWQMEMWKAAALDEVALLDYFVYLNYPTADGRKVAIVDPPELAWEAKLEEENVYGDAKGQKQQTLNWHGNSRSGNVTGHLVYANGGSREDFEKLREMGINVNGSIALVRYYHTQGDRALKVKAAELAGAVGCLIYSDPKEDGFMQGEPLPNGPWRPSDSVQRGAVSLMSWIVGDVLTPGWASTLKSDRVSEFGNPGLPNIPSLPLAWRDAQPLLQSLKTHGKQVPFDDWKGGVPEVSEWWTGDTSSPQVLLQNLQDENKLQQIWNLHGLIQGLETANKKVIVGNHRDAWCFGSVDPGSGTAVLMEVVNIFGDLRKLGWRPLRSIEFVSWDAEEYNLVGSTEYVEDHVDKLRADAVAYLNVDVGVAGSQFRAAASPLYQRALMHVLDRVDDPSRNITLRKFWEDSGAELEGLGAGSDYVAFQDIAGTSSIDFGFEGPPNGYPYHSCYETFQWMDRFGDPGFGYHQTLAQVWALLILELADQPILPFDLNAYATAIHGYIDTMEKDIAAASRGNDKSSLDVQSLRTAANYLAQNAKELHSFDDYWTAQVLGRGGFESNAYALKRIEHNDRLATFETDLLDLPGMFEGDEHEQHGVSDLFRRLSPDKH